MIELGAGCGLVGLVFAALGAKVLLTDLPNVLVSNSTGLAYRLTLMRCTGGAIFAVAMCTA